MKKLHIQGVEETNSNPGIRLEGVDSAIKVKAKYEVSIASARDGGAEETLTNIKHDDLMLLEFEDGIFIWTRVDQFEEDFPESTSRGGDANTLEIPRQLQLGDHNRGVSEWLLKSLKIFDIDPVGKTATAIGKMVEKGLDRPPGLYRCTINTNPGKEAKHLLKLEVPEEKLDGSKPMLLFIHGTASSSSGSFGDLWSTSPNKHLVRLQHYFGKHIYALEHRTLTESPIKNAIDLVKELHTLADTSASPKPLQIHMASHSRGGLVAELLARVDVGKDEAPISDKELKQYVMAGTNYTKQVAQLKQLCKLLDARIEEGEFKGDRKFNIHRFVRTACPARGTTLASGRLDRWLTVILNVIGTIPLLKASNVYDAFSTFTLAVVKERTDPKELPGLEAQMPTSPLVRLLNLSNSVVNADLSVISGDVEADTMWGKLKYLIPDLYYRQDHDLVVNTRSMTGGTRRKEQQARKFFDQGPDVNHFQYFSNDKTAKMLVDGLLRAEKDTAGFTPIQEKPGLLRSRSAQIKGDKPIVFVLPGIMGSHLQVNENRIWLDMLDIASGGMRRLKIDSNDVSAESLISSAYADLVRFLEQQHDVIPYPYDWRLPISTEAGRFAHDLEKKLQLAEQHNQPLHIIAHSMGGLVARMAFAMKPDLWGRLVGCKGRLLMLGTPHKGSHVITRVLVGQEKMVKYLALADFGHSQKGLLKIISAFPGILQLLPFKHGSQDMLDMGIWKQLADADGSGWVAPTKKDLDEATSFWEKISEFKMNHAHMLYVAGKAPATPMDIKLVTSRSGEQKIVFPATAKGDGRVTWESGIPSNIRCWYANASHGDLADHNKVFSGYLELLQSGNTGNQHLSPEPIIERGETDKPFLMPIEEHVDMLPDEEMLFDSILGAERKIETTEVTTPLKIVISHGNLCYASNTLALGHYRDDLIVSAEGYVNQLFDNRLRKRMLLGLYPGPLNTAEIINNPKPFPARPEAVLIIGLGEMGALTRRSLAETYCYAALQYAISVSEKHAGEANLPSSVQELRLSSLLIGTGAGGISIEDSLHAMTRGLIKANQQLQQMDCDNFRFVELEFVESWEDIANAAAHALCILDEDASIHGQVVFEKALSLGHGKGNSGAKVNKIAGARARVTFDESAGWWRRLQISHIDKDNSLRFNTLTDKARTEISLQAIDLAQVDTFIEQSMRSTYDDPDISKTLFEMLLPHQLKEQSLNLNDHVLVLNEKAARYPWELLQNRWANKSQTSTTAESLPMSVEFGMIRQLESETFRASPVTRGNKALVIGNPLGNSNDFPELPGAESEAATVRSMLNSRNQHVTEVLGRDSKTDARRVILALHADSYRIMHFAGHGVYNYAPNSDSESCDLCGQRIPSSSRVTGMVIGDNNFLTPANIKSIRFVPELVFINCCHLGREEGIPRLKNPHKLAANLATEFIRMGVKAVIAAGWAVNDRAAETFANTFYSLMLDGRHFGEAVRDARKATFLQHRGCNTWGAYQCYGNPDFQLNLAGRAESHSYKEEAVSETELASKINNIANDSKISGADIPCLRKKLESLQERIPDHWMNKDVREALGLAFSELGDLHKATDHYRAALDDKNSSVSLQTIEQLVNLQAKLAVRQWQDGSPETDQHSPTELVNASIGMMKDLLKFGESSERLSILASTYKRKAWITTGNTRIAALRRMQEYYRIASELAPGDSYPLYNYLTAKMVVGWRKNGGKCEKQLQQEVAALAASVTGNEIQRDFWSLVRFADCQFLKRLVCGEITTHQAVIISYYSIAKKRAGSPGEFSCVTEHIDFLALMAQSQITHRGRKRKTMNSLREILNSLTSEHQESVRE